ncbi:MAG: 3-phosphoshikimate 1-carboxyvinyltransferase [Fimbriimonadaceae bacterium]|nr:3-phosphoshikimate 1-carboxyvinyltransferase [Fimbriimonadaceae bacterium]QYK55631.1 MAG: 3-phosphoshikimate 1-carboxyvinyltransferase [Fimbriimonadaceae bacterium]
MSHSSSITLGRIAGLNGTVRPPGDKSLTHRAYLLAAMAEPAGVPSYVARPLDSNDCQRTLDCLAELGTEVEHFPDGEMGDRPFTMVWPNRAWASPDIPLDCGNSGTTIRLLSGLIAACPGVVATLSGDASLSKRPMGRIAEPLRQMGADFRGETPPVTIAGRPLKGIDFVSPVASAQVKSCVLLAGLRARGTTWVREPAQSRDHTERMLEALGVELLDREDGAVGLDGGQTWPPFEFEVPGDISSATFFLVGAAMLPGSQVRLACVGINSTRTGALEVLEAAGVDIGLDGPRDHMGEPVADLVVRGHSGLKAFEVSGDLVPRLIDEIPALAVLATQCEGVTRFRDASELRVKESDRIETVAQALRAMGAKVETYPDGMDVEGPVALKGATIDANGDHRIAMAFAIAGLVAEGETRIEGAEAVGTSYPTFMRDLESLTVV